MSQERKLTNQMQKSRDEAISQRNLLVDHLLESGFIRDKKTEDAFRKVPRHLFLPGIELQEAYSNGSIITKQLGIEPVSSSTAPSLVASMLELLQVEKGMKVLEIGTGTGYNVALLAELVGDEGKVFSVDIDIETIQEAQKNLVSADYKKIIIECANGAKGLPEHSLYDRIIMTCSVRNIPKPLVDQLREGGIIVLPIWFNGTQLSPALKKDSDGNLIGLSTTLGGFMEMRSKTFQEMQAEQKGTGELLISSEHAELFPEEKLKPFLLQYVPEERELPVEGILPPRGSSFFIFAALHEKKSVELFLEENTPKFGFGDSAAGIVDLNNNSACLISKDNRVFVYGNPSAYQRVVRLAEEWERLKRPDVKRMQVFAFLNSQPTLERSDLLFEEKLPPLVIRILGEQI